MTRFIRRLGSECRELFFRAVYRIKIGKFKSLGRGVRIAMSARFLNVQNISLGNGVCIMDHCVVNASPKGRIVIGDNCYIGRSSAVVDAGGFLDLGNRIQLGSFCILTGQGGIKIGDAALFAPRVSVIANQHMFDDPNLPVRDQPEKCSGITIGSGGWFGVGAVILDGVAIGDNVVVGANAVVTRDIASHSVAVGVPANVLRTIQ